MKDSEISTIDDFTRKTCCFRWSITSIVLTYLIIVGLLIYIDQAHTFNLFGNMIADTNDAERYLSYGILLMVPPLNFLFIYWGARYILYCLLYPYQNSIQREWLDRSNNERFGKEFCYYLECFLYTF